MIDGYKIKIFCGDDRVSLENTINEFIKDKNIIDVKYKPLTYATQYDTRVGYPTNITVHDRVLIIYKE